MVMIQLAVLPWISYETENIKGKIHILKYYSDEEITDSNETL